MKGMPFVAELNIADVHFRVTSTLPVDSVPSSGPYASFLGSAGENPQTIGLDIQIRRGEVPPATDLQRLFADHSWALYRDAAIYHLEFRSAVPDEPLWTARFGEDAREITVFGGPQMLQESDRGPTMLNPLCYPLDQLLWVYALAHRQGLLLHAAGATVNGRALAFPGRGGAGKTTLARLLDGDPRFSVLSDDRIALRCLDGLFSAYGTPWPGDARIAVNEGAPLAALLFLVHSERNAALPLSPQQALRRLLPVVSIPWYDRQAIEPMLQTCEQLVSSVPAFDLHFAPDVEVLDFLQRFLLTL